MKTYGDYQQFNQAMTPEQIEEQRALNSAAQFFDKTNALGHQPSAPPLCNDFGGQLGQPQRDGKHGQQFDSEAHRAFMRSLG